MERRGQTGWEPCFIYPRHGAETTEVVSEDQKGKKKKCHNKSLSLCVASPWIGQFELPPSTAASVPSAYEAARGSRASIPASKAGGASLL